MIAVVPIMWYQVRHFKAEEANEVIDGIPIRRFRYAPRSMETLAYTGTMGAQVRESVRGKIAMGSYLVAAARAARLAARRTN